jgi:hypothetical protein
VGLYQDVPFFVVRLSHSLLFLLAGLGFYQDVPFFFIRLSHGLLLVGLGLRLFVREGLREGCGQLPSFLGFVRGRLQVVKLVQFSEKLGPHATRRTMATVRVDALLWLETKMLVHLALVGTQFCEGWRAAKVRQNPQCATADSATRLPTMGARLQVAVLRVDFAWRAAPCTRHELGEVQAWEIVRESFVAVSAWMPRSVTFAAQSGRAVRTLNRTAMRDVSRENQPTLLVGAGHEHEGTILRSLNLGQVILLHEDGAKPCFEAVDDQGGSTPETRTWFCCKAGTRAILGVIKEALFAELVSLVARSGWTIDFFADQAPRFVEVGRFVATGVATGVAIVLAFDTRVRTLPAREDVATKFLDLDRAEKRFEGIHNNFSRDKARRDASVQYLAEEFTGESVGSYDIARGYDLWTY